MSLKNTVVNAYDQLTKECSKLAGSEAQRKQPA
jgi:hypothetical protein